MSSISIYFFIFDILINVKKFSLKNIRINPIKNIKLIISYINKLIK